MGRMGTFGHSGALLAAALLSACPAGDDEDSPSGSSCVPGAQLACGCEGNTVGTQICQPGGKSLSACQCGGAPGGTGGEAGTGGELMAGTGGMAGSAGEAGSGGTGGTGGAGTGGMSGVGGTAGTGGTGGTTGGEGGRLEGIVAEHNAVRDGLGLPALTWDDDLAAQAQDWADELTNAENCGTIFHRQPNSYGENIAAFASSQNPVSDQAQAVDGWAAEVACWAHGAFMTTDSCDMGCTDAMNSSGCGHYTQLVWENTQRVGCGVATCSNGAYDTDVWVCNYDPPGNVVGQEPY